MRYYETYYELYGRTVNLVTFEGTGNATDEVAARADAAQIALQYKPFVVLGGPALTSAFADELAAHKVICIACTPGQPASFYSDRDPYVWGLDGSPLQKQAHVVEFLTKQIIGKNASHGGDAVKDKPRKLGLIYLENSAAAKDVAESVHGGDGRRRVAVRRGCRLPARSEHDPGNRHAGDHADEGCGGHDGGVQRRPGGAA